MTLRQSRGSMITEPKLIKLPKLSSTIKTGDQQNKKPNKKDIFFIRPQIKKILYDPCDLHKQKKVQNHQLMIQSALLNKSYKQLQEQLLQQRIHTYFNKNQSLNLQKRSSLTVKNRVLVGKQAPLQFYKEYKQLGRLLQKSNSNKQNHYQSPYLSMLQRTQKLDILPLTMGIVKFQGDANVLNLNNYSLGDKYIIALSAGLKKAKAIQKCNLSANRITNKGFEELVKNLNHQVISLDVSYNQISQLDDKLMQLIAHHEGRIQKLNFQKNQIKKPETIFRLVQNITISKHFKVLNLRQNGLSSNCQNSIFQLIDMETHLQQLYLGRNFLSAKTAEKIFQLLTKNKNITVFDYSSNNLGQDQNNLCAKSIANCLTKNKTLHHVDLSSNSFTQEGSAIIAAGLQPNKKIYGFHFNGNHGYIDPKGFIIPQEKQLTSLHSLVQSKIDSYNICFKRQNLSATPKMFKNVCWICEGWYEQQFRFIIPDDNKNDKKLVYIHFDFQLFAPRLINLNDKHVKYTTMVPPTKYHYFFTFEQKQYLDKNAKSTILQFPQKYTYQMYHQQITFQVKQVSERPKAKPRKIVNDWNEIVINTLPRHNGLISKKQKQKWSYDKSSWAKQWKLDNDDLLKKCFQRDWKCSKLMNLVKNQQDQDKVKQKLWQAYKAIKLIYRYFSSWSPFGDIWAVSNNTWTQFCQQSKILNKDTPLKITDLTFITTNSMSGADWKGNILVPERGLVRFQFMQCLVRLSEQKYKKLGITDNFADSINILLKDHVIPLANTLPYQNWRLKQFFVEENDVLIKKYRPIFTYIYKKNSKLKVKPGQKPFMCLNQFRSIMQRANLAGNLVLQRDIYVSFNCGMMTQIDQLQNQRFIKMTQIQFIQGIARCASILPKSCTLSSSSQQKLHFKFQWLINQLKNTQCNQQIRSQFNQQGSIFDQNSEDN